MDAEINLSEAGIRNNYGYLGEGDPLGRCVLSHYVALVHMGGKHRLVLARLELRRRRPAAICGASFKGAPRLLGGVDTDGRCRHVGKHAAGTPTEHGFYWSYIDTNWDATMHYVCARKFSFGILS